MNFAALTFLMLIKFLATHASSDIEPEGRAMAESLLKKLQPKNQMSVFDLGGYLGIGGGDRRNYGGYQQRGGFCSSSEEYFQRWVGLFDILK